MVQISSCLHSTFKDLSNEYSHTDLSNEYSHAQIRVKMKKLWSRQVGEEKQVVVQKLSRDQEIVLQLENLVATRKLGRDQEIVSRLENLVATKKTVSRPKMLEKPKKRLKIDILT